MLLRQMILIIISLFLTVPAYSSVQNETVKTDSLPDKYEGWIIDEIKINNENIFETETEKYNKFIYKLTNKFHIKTKKFIVAKEVLLKKGDRVQYDLISETERNIRENLNVYDAKVEVVPKDSGKVDLIVTTWDQWSLTGGLSFNREGNESKTKLGLLEKNLLGLNQYLLFDYIFQTDDDNFFNFIFLSKRIKNNYNFKFNLNTDPKYKVLSLSFYRPFYRLDDKHSYYVQSQFFKRRFDYYRDQYLLGSSNFTGETISVGYKFRSGKKIRTFNGEINYSYNFAVAENTQIYSSNGSDSSLVDILTPVDSISHSFSIGGGLIQNKFIKLNKVNALFYNEDFRIGSSFYATFLRAFTQDFPSYHFDKFALAAEHNFNFSNHLLFMNASYSYWYHKSSKLGSNSFFQLTYMGRYSQYLTLAFRTKYRFENDLRYPDQLSLDGVNDIRGYDKYFKTGSKEMIMNVELRFFTDIELLTAIFGGVIFADIGNSWKKVDPVELDNLIKSVGFGLRIGFTRSTRKVIRMDLAFTDQEQWEFSVATGQFFTIGSIF